MAFGAVKGTWTFTANSIVASNAATLATGSAVVAKGDLIVVVIGEQTGNTSTGASDTLGNTYTAITAGTLGGGVSGRAFYTIVTNAGTNTNINVAATGSADNVAIVAASYEGSFTAIDKSPANNNNTDNASPFTCPATGTLAQQVELIAAWMVDNTANVKTATSPNLKDNQANSQTVLSTVLGHQVVNSTSTVSPAFTGTNPTGSQQGTASFKAADLPAGEIVVSYPLTPLVSGSWRSFRTFISAPNHNLLGGVPVPFSQEDWPLPIPPDYPVLLRAWTNALPKPVEPTVDLSVHRQPHFTRPRQGTQFNYDLPINVAALIRVVVQDPFRQRDWPVPTAPSALLQTWAVSFNQNMPPPVPPPPPTQILFAQTVL